MPRFFTVGSIAQYFSLPAWQVRRAIERGFLSEPPRVGAYRVFLPDDLPRVRAALKEAGYLDVSEVTTHE